VNIIAFLFSLVLFVGGFYVMGSSFYVPGFEALLFIAGILCCALAIIIPVHVLKRIDG
jgi:hypothetical protein